MFKLCKLKVLHLTLSLPVVRAAINCLHVGLSLTPSYGTHINQLEKQYNFLFLSFFTLLYPVQLVLFSMKHFVVLIEKM